MSPRPPRIFFDGGCRPNPGPIEAAAVSGGIVHFFNDLGTGTSSDAEWLALIAATRLAQQAGLTEVVLIGDAQAVIRQGNAALASGSASSVLAKQFLAAAAGLARIRLRWVRRGRNLAGIALAARHPR